jgi:hypothetical protein
MIKARLTCRSRMIVLLVDKYAGIGENACA